MRQTSRAVAPHANTATVLRVKGLGRGMPEPWRAARHDEPCFSIEPRMVSSLRMQAVRVSIFVLPAASSSSYPPPAPPSPPYPMGKAFLRRGGSYVFTSVKEPI